MSNRLESKALMPNDPERELETQQNVAAVEEEARHSSQ